MYTLGNVLLMDILSFFVVIYLNITILMQLYILQLEVFRQLTNYCPHCSQPEADDEDGGLLTHNFRPTQPRNFMSHSMGGDEAEVERPLRSYTRRYRRTGVFVKEEGDDESSASDASSSEDEDSSADEEEVE